MSHFTEENRKTISSMIAHNNTCVDIAEAVGCDPTTIAKEIKRNRVISRESTTKNKFLCKKLERFPYVCADCSHKYRDCVFAQLRYNAEIAQKNMNINFMYLDKVLTYYKFNSDSYAQIYKIKNIKHNNF